MTIYDSAKNALTALFDEAEARDYDPPANPLAVAELEWIISVSRCGVLEPSPVKPENDPFYVDDGDGEDKCANWKPLGNESDAVAGTG